jgi:hypothetical protein
MTPAPAAALVDKPGKREQNKNYGGTRRRAGHSRLSDGRIE